MGKERDTTPVATPVAALVAALGIGALMATDALAQQATEAELDTIAVSPAVEAPPPPPTDGEAPVALEEIIVTANKRNESASKLAGAVTAIDSATLQATGASQLAEYLSLSPGVNFNSSTPGYSVITIRGVSSDTINSLAQTAVGVYFDDIPLTDPAAPMVVADIDAFDAKRIEVLRGPQGALYGSASLGGAVNYIPQAPDTHDVLFAAQASGSQSTNASIGGSAKAMFNTPLIDDVLALRMVGHYTRVPGYIDNVGTGEDGANNVVTKGGRATLGWTPGDDTTVRLTGLYQQTRVDDAAYVDPREGDLQKNTLAPEPSDNTIRLVNLRVEQAFDAGTLSLIGGYQDKDSALEYDGATALGLNALGQRVLLQQTGGVKGYSAELRFVSAPDDTFEYLVGASYADRDEQFDVLLNLATLGQSADALDALFAQLGLAPPAVIGDLTTLVAQHAEIGAPEKALFAEGSWRFFDDFKLTFGGRYYDNRVDSTIDGHGLLLVAAGGTSFTESRSSGAKGFNPKVSLAWQLTDDALLYALYSRGYRLGGPNVVPSTPLFRTQPNYGPDEVDNYEIGTKTAWFDRRLTLDLTAFWIDWKDIQLVVSESTGTFKYLDNAGNARIKGAELALAAQPFDFLTARSSLTYLDARLREDYDPNNNRPPAEKGDRLPGSPEWAVTNTLTASWPDRFAQPSVTLIHRYEGESSTSLSFQDVKKGGYNLFDLRAGVVFGDFTLTAFGKNLTDKRGVTAANNYTQPSGEVLSLQFVTPPRVVGLELGYRFTP